MNKEKKLFNILGIALLLILLILIAWTKFNFHELWKDEWQAWLVSRDIGFWGLPSFLNYEGHPPLWYLYLKIWTALSSILPFSEAACLQFSHLLLVALAFFTIIFRIKIPWLLKFFFLGSYFTLFEYGVVNRGYILVLLFGLWAVHELLKSQFNPWRFGIAILLLIQTEVYGLMIAGALMFYFLLKEKTWESDRWKSREIQIPTGLFILSFLLFVLLLYPSKELSNTFDQQIFSSGGFESIALAFQGLLANTFFVGLINDTGISGIQTSGLLLALVALALTIAFLWTEKKLLMAFLTFLIVFLIFSMNFFVGGLRQWGNLIILFFLLSWILNERVGIKKYQLVIFCLLFIAQLRYAYMALERDINLPFSNALSASQFLDEKVPEGVPVLSLNGFETVALNAYSKHPFYLLPDGEAYTYMRWRDKIYLPTESELKLFAKFKNRQGLILVSPKQIDQNRFPNTKLWERFDQFNLRNENFYIYTLQVDSN